MDTEMVKLLKTREEEKKKERVQHKDKIKALVMYKRRIKLYLT